MEGREVDMSTVMRNGTQTAQVLGFCVPLALGGPNLCDGDKIGAVEHAFHSIQSEELPAEAMSCRKEAYTYIQCTWTVKMCHIQYICRIICEFSSSHYTYIVW